MPSCAHFEPDSLPDLLPIYYNRIFPYGQYYKWLSYGGVSKNYFLNREFSFTLADDIYIRYQSFKNKDEMEKEIKKCKPHKIDIGAVYNFRPKDHRTVSVFTAMEKELVFDIDMTDYDEVRTCCTGAEICNKCWQFMTVAVKILDSALREDFGYQHLLWVYSGRRGVHCWVCDTKARGLSQSARSALAEYLQLIRGGEGTSKKVNLGQKMHPSIKRAYKIANSYFEELVLKDQDLLGTQELWKKVLAMIPDEGLRESLEKVMSKCANSIQRWNTIKAEIEKVVNKGEKKGVKPYLVAEIVLQLVYPRLDINVTKGLNHLLKSPFCVHPKTGRVCVCFDPAAVDDFDPMEVPHLGQLVEEINQYDAGKSEEERNAVAEYKKTSMKTAMAIFDSFLNELGKENAALRLEKSDQKQDF